MKVRFTHADRSTTTSYRVDWTLAAGGPVLHSQSVPVAGTVDVPSTDPQQYEIGLVEKPSGQPVGQSYKVTLTAIRNGQEAASAPSAAFEIDAPLAAPGTPSVVDPLV